MGQGDRQNAVLSTFREDQIKLTWTKVRGGMLSCPPFREDQMRLKGEDDTWLQHTSWGSLGFFRITWILMPFDRSLKLLPRDTADFDFVQLARDSFVAMAGRQEQWPSWINFLAAARGRRRRISPLLGNDRVLIRAISAFSHAPASSYSSPAAVAQRKFCCVTSFSPPFLTF